MWLIVGVLPLLLQMRSYMKFVKPHQIPEILVVSPDLQKEAADLMDMCPVQASVLAGIWWNVEATHYYKARHGNVCHVIVPQYNLHGNYVIGSEKTTPHSTTPANCANDSYPYEMYMYHGSIGYFSFFKSEFGTFCTKDKTAYIAVKVLGAYDINGVSLVEDTGSTNHRVSYWYGSVGALWLLYRALTIRRSYIACRRYGRRCDHFGEILTQQEAVVFVQESLRLSAHGATNYHRSALLYLVVEGVMTDMFLIIAHDGWAARVQYASLGYNLSGLMLLLFEMVESMRWLSEKWRLRIKRMLFSYEAVLVGELVTSIVFQMFYSGMNGSDLKRSKPTALAVSYYLWGLICHGIVVIAIILIISSVRVPWSLIFAWIKHRSIAVFSEPCCVDTALGVRSRSTLLGGYRLEGGHLYYTPTALKAYGLLKMADGDAVYLVQHKLHWFTVPRENLIGIGVITGSRVEPCSERPCTGIVHFLDDKLGGGLILAQSQQNNVNVRPNKILAWVGPGGGNLSPPTQSIFPVKWKDSGV